MRPPTDGTIFDKKSGSEPQGTVELQPRTEFIVLFVWREPQPGAAAANPAADEKK